MSQRLLRLLPIALGYEDLAMVAWLGTALAARLGVVPVQEASLALDPDWREPESGRFSSNRVVDAIIDRAEGEVAERAGDWTLAITAEDLVAPDREFVFGEATLGGPCAVISLARLRSGDEPEILRERALKEALHEIGHLAGLSHCRRAHCVMAASELARDVDGKRDSYCAECRGLLPLAP